MNASFRRASTQDKFFKQFAKDHRLSTPTECNFTFAFYHYNGKDASQIDYFLQSDELIDTYITVDREPLSSSTHNTILVKVSCEFDAVTDPSEQIFVPKLRWDKIDKTT